MSVSGPKETHAPPATEFEKLYRVLGGHIFFQTLAAAVRLDLFSLLKRQGSLSRAQIARHLGIEEKPARILLLGCVALELIRKSGPLYSNSEIADCLLVRDVPGNIVSVIEWQHFINYRAMYFLYDSIKANTNVGLDIFPGEEKTLYGRLAHDPKLENVFQQAMEAISVHANQLLAQSVDFSNARHLVDVGGGNGSNAITLVSKYPRMRVTVLDSPSVCEIARKNIEARGMSDRIGVSPGDCFQDPFPEGADCLLFCHFFTIWPEETSRDLLKKCHESLPHGGSVVIFNMMQRDDETGPLMAAIGSPYFLTLATGGGMLYTWNEYETWLKDAGFGEVQRHELPRDHGAIIGVKG